MMNSFTQTSQSVFLGAGECCAVDSFIFKRDSVPNAFGLLYVDVDHDISRFRML
jgi:hypothetical protein